MRNIRKRLAGFLALALVFSLLSTQLMAITAVDNDKDDTVEDIFGDSTETVNGAVTFENGDKNCLIGNVNLDVAKSHYEVVSNPKKDTVNGSDNVLNIVTRPNENASGNAGIYVVSEVLLPEDTPIYTVNFKMYLTGGEGSANFRYPSFVYDYQDANNWQAISFQFYNNQITALSHGAPFGNGGYSRPTNSAKFHNTPYRLANSDTTGALPNNTWIDVSAVYSANSVKITIVTQEGYAQTLYREAVLNDGRQTLVGFYVSDSNGVMIDDLAVNAYGTEDATAASNFMKKNAAIFRYRASTLSRNEQDLLDQALEGYEALSSTAKAFIPHTGVYIAELSARMAVIAEDENYLHAVPAKDYWGKYNRYTFTDTFDDASSISQYYDMTEIHDSDSRALLGEPGTVKYNETMGSSALSISESAYLVKPGVLPTKAKVVSVEFDYMVSSKRDGIHVYDPAYPGIVAYANAENYYAFYFHNMPDQYAEGQMTLTEFRQRRSCYSTDGSFKPFGSPGSLENYFSLGEKLHVAYFYSEKSIEVLITRASDPDYVIYESQFQFARPGQQFALAGGNANYNTWIDNLTITYEQGNWDDDVDVADINVYYSGASMQKPGDVVTLNGDSLGILINKVEVQAINGPLTDRKYYDYQAFNTAGVTAETYSQDPSVIPWDDDAAVETPILQTTADSVKFIIPMNQADGSEMPQGVYALKLSGMDAEANPIEKIIVINAAHMDAWVGDDGPRVSPGGYIEVMGKTIAFPLKNTETEKDYSNLQALLVNASGDVVAELPIQTVFSDYNLRLTVPEEIPKGTYELWLYGGYGWSVPLKVDITDSVKDQLLEQKRINVLDNPYTGTEITGERLQNATPYIQQLLAILAEEGGGILYFPKGGYRFQQPLIVPENVCIIGENMVDTVFIWTSFNWGYGNLPGFLIGLDGNNIIQNLDIYCHRTGGIFNMNGQETQNIYIDSVRTYQQVLGGATTSGSSAGSFYSPTELKLLNSTEKYTATVNAPEGTQLVNFQLTNCVFQQYGAESTTGRGLSLTYHSNKSSYYQIYDCDLKVGWSPGVASNCVIRDVEYTDSCFSITGANIIYDRNYVHDNTTNNRELFVGDEGPHLNNMSGMYKDTSDPSGRTWYVNVGTRSAAAIKDLQMFITSGQGEGQARLAKAAMDTYMQGYVKVTFDEPFQVEPNRNSIYMMRYARQNIYFVNNSYYNGSTVGWFGGAAGTVFDGNTYQRVGNQYVWPMTGDVIWYQTYNREKTVYDPFFISGYGTEENSNFTRFRVYSGRAKSVRAVVMRNCDFAGRYISFKNDGENSVWDFVVDKCSFSNCEYAYLLDGSVGGGKGFDGLMLYGNTYQDIDQIFVKMDEVFKAKNTIFTLRGAHLENTVLADISGDVDLDGELTLQDALMLQMYLIGQAELSEKQMIRADYNGDATVNLKDVLFIMEAVADPANPPVIEPPATEPPETQPPETQPPETQPPETQPPTTEPPTTQPGTVPEVWTPYY